MAGKSTVSTKEPKINQLNVQKSSYGVVLGMGWGRTRISCNLWWFGDFRATAKTTTTSNGGKGGVSQKSTTYTYDGALVLGLCKGPIAGVRSVYRDKSVFTDGGTTALAQAGLSLALGTAGQAVWGYLTTNHPTEAIPYSELAYVYASAYPLGEGASMPNHSFEVDFASQVSGLPDANPKDILEQFLAAVPGWQSGLIGSTTAYSQYCLANNILLSPFLESQQPAQQFITDLMKITNSDVVWSEGLMKVVPLGDQAATGNGATYTPNITPLYDLDDNHFMDSDEPVRVDTKRLADAWNIIQVEHLDRGHQYNVTIATASDQAAIDAFGKRKQSPFKAQAICEPSIGRFVAQLLLQRELYVRQTFHFRLGDVFCHLDPLDLVTITDSGLGLTRELVRIISIEEDEDGYLAVEAEQTLIGMASAPLYGSQGTSGGYGANYDAAPGNVATPVVFNPPTSLTDGFKEVWAAVAGVSANWGGCEVWASFDATNYQRVGLITGPARYGTLTATLPATADPDTTSVLKIDLTTSKGAISQASQADADRDATLCLVGSELMSYRDAVLTAAYKYDIDYLRRGRFGTVVASKAIGAVFIRLDDAIFKLPYSANQEGATVSLKFLSFNVYGRARQALSDVSAYTVTPTETAATGSGVTGLTLAHTALTAASTVVPQILATCALVTDPLANAIRYEYRKVNDTVSYFTDVPIDPAFVGTLGVTTGTATYNTAADEKVVIPIVAPAAGVCLSKLVINLATSAAGAKLRAVIYADSAGVPGALVAAGSDVTLAGTEATQDVNLPLTTPVTLTPGATYWIGVHGNNAAVDYRCVGSGSASRRRTANTFASGSSDPFGTSTTNASYIRVSAPFINVMKTGENIIGNTQYEARAAVLYTIPRDPVFSAWVQASGTTVAVTVPTAGTATTAGTISGPTGPMGPPGVIEF